MAIANTGVAGPENGDDGTPAGTVCFAWAFDTGHEIFSFGETLRFHKNRNEVREATVRHGLERIPHYHALINKASV